MLGTIWGWTLLATPIAFVAGIIWIRRASALRTPIEAVPSMPLWILVSVASVVLFVGLGLALFLIGMGHGGAPVFSNIAMYTMLVGPFLYCAYALWWINKIRRGLREQRSRA